MAGDHAAAFLKAYDKYVAVRTADKLQAVPLLSCIDPDLLPVLEERSHDEIQDNDRFRTYLENQTHYDSARLAIEALQSTVMRLDIKDIEARIDDYDKSFFKVKSRVAASGLHLKPDVYCRAYVNGLRPSVLQDEVRDELQCSDTSLSTLMVSAAEAARLQHRQFLASHDHPRDQSSRDKRDGKKKVEFTRATSEHKPSSSSPNSSHHEAAPSSLKDRLRHGDGLCSKCRAVKWTHEHWISCTGPYSYSNPKKKDANDIKSEHINTVTSVDSPL